MRIAVIGRGLIGSASAKYLAQAGHEVLLIGPDEPNDKTIHAGVFASHYDEGRITRALDADPFWSRVSRASIARYRDIEVASGVSFFNETGAMMAGPATGALMRAVAGVRDAECIESDQLNAAALAKRFVFFRFDQDVLAFHERLGAGHLSPRRLVQAQTILAQRFGAKVIACEAAGVRAISDGIVVDTTDGPVHADHVLIAAGAFSAMLLDQPLRHRVYARTVAFFELGALEIARLREMPSLVYQAKDGRDPYLLPPIRYPDGKTYLKLGGDLRDVILDGPEAIKDWFRGGGNAAVGAALRAAILDRMPGLKFERMHIEPCVTTFTDTDRPDIRHLDPRVAIATAGCGRGAKCSDELGRMAADLYPNSGNALDAG